MVIYSNRGRIIRVIRTQEEADLHGQPEAFDDSVEVDFKVNQNVLQNLMNFPKRHTIVAGVLKFDGAAVPINPPGDSDLTQKALRGLNNAKLGTIRRLSKEFLQAVANNTAPTAAQRDGAIAFGLYLHFKKTEEI